MKYADMIFQGAPREQLDKVQLHLGRLYEKRIALERELREIEVSERICREMAKRLIADMPTGLDAIAVRAELAKQKALAPCPMKGARGKHSYTINGNECSCGAIYAEPDWKIAGEQIGDAIKSRASSL